MGTFGLRTPRDIDAAARWTVAEPKGWAFLATRGAAFAFLVWASDHWGNLGWLAGMGALVLAWLIAPGPPDRDKAPGRQTSASP